MAVGSALLQFFYHTSGGRHQWRPAERLGAGRGDERLEIQERLHAHDDDGVDFVQLPSDGGAFFVRIQRQPALVHGQIVDAGATAGQFVGEKLAAGIAADDTDGLAVCIHEHRLFEEMFRVETASGQDVHLAATRLERRRCRRPDRGDRAGGIAGPEFGRVAADVNRQVRFRQGIGVAPHRLGVPRHDLEHRERDHAAAAPLDRLRQLRCRLRRPGVKHGDAGEIGIRHSSPRRAPGAAARRRTATARRVRRPARAPCRPGR